MARSIIYLVLAKNEYCCRNEEQVHFGVAFFIVLVNFLNLSNVKTVPYPQSCIDQDAYGMVNVTKKHRRQSIF